MREAPDCSWNELQPAEGGSEEVRQCSPIDRRTSPPERAEHAGAASPPPTMREAPETRR